MKKSVDPISQEVKAKWEEVFQKASAAYKATYEQKQAWEEERALPVKLKISLQDLPHPCERVLLLPPDISMRQLHFFIQWSMGWMNSHLFDFSNSLIRPSISVGMVFEDLDEYGPPTRDAHDLMLEPDFLEEVNRKPFYYLYDFGDHWVHKINVLKPTKKELEDFDGYPVCLKAVGKCPPEDVGSTSGYEEFLEVVNDPKHPDF